MTKFLYEDQLALSRHRAERLQQQLAILKSKETENPFLQFNRLQVTQQLDLALSEVDFLEKRAENYRKGNES